MKFIYYSIFIFFFSSIAIGQEVNVDETLANVKREVEKENYDKALSLIEPLRAKFPENEDIQVYTGRIYSWKKDYKTAVKILSPMTDRVNPNPEALQAIINIYFWSEDYEKCITYCDKYLVIDPKSIDVLKIKATCLEKLNRDQEALDLIEKASFIDNSTQAFSGIRTLIGRKAKNTVSASYLNISTSEPGQSPFHYGYVEYSHKFSKSAIVGRANVGHINDDTQMLFEADYYQTFSNKSYLYSNGGISTGETIFPVAKAGLEYYFAPHKKFDYSLGARFMHFDTDDITLLTGQIAYTAGTYTVAYRPYYDTSNELFSHVLSLQKVNEEKERLIRFELQYGNVPYLYLYNSFTQPLKAYRAGMQYQHRFGESFFVRPIFLYEREEYIPGEYRNRYNVQLIVTKRF
ncbi:YaiO family outer membrane beta-barrel protein [Flavobacterium sp. S87F.05.LMB.W.Kidney.N]|uniref:YaiO family outer membrane beta-barrel protein n=1 Tax=Flavobacterium sp. S87F.05.LMB.W.Kidney.N TaxID=1278758 RepID=UPI001064CA8E|nr:YaiO family outer membrane beta-barrel protein [Flavobacterium sp. S87F.05.LMB.W.Kidney.N]TDX10603.1 YaiO family outer membrane protein [Flavobacterium sp. S87F.05.LMB.W.Kidney.N]